MRTPACYRRPCLSMRLQDLRLVQQIIFLPVGMLSPVTDKYFSLALSLPEHSVLS